MFRGCEIDDIKEAEKCDGQMDEYTLNSVEWHGEIRDEVEVFGIWLLIVYI